MTARQEMTTAHGRELGAVLGNPQPDPTGLPGVTRDADVLLEYGDPETQLGIKRRPLAVFRRDRGHSDILLTFTHEADAERFLLVREFPSVVVDWEEAPERYLWPAGVRVIEAAQQHTAAWDAVDGVHEISMSSVFEIGSVCRAVWVRDVPIGELLQRALRP